MGEESGALFVGSRKWFEIAGFGEGSTIESGKAGIEVDFIFGEEASVVGVLGPDHAVDEEIERGPQIGDDFLVETGKKFGVFIEIFFLRKIEPVMEE